LSGAALRCLVPGMDTRTDVCPRPAPPPAILVRQASTEAALSSASDDVDLADFTVVKSGHFWPQKIRFSTSQISPMACGTVLLFAKDLYIIEMGADVQMMGVIGVVLSIWGPCCYPVAGYVLERNLLGAWFPWDAWGRRAPWFLTHSLVLAVATAAVYMPPILDSTFLCLWFLACGVVLCWVLAVLFTCFEAARTEMYPTKEERSEVEAVVRITSAVGVALGIMPQLFVAAAGATFAIRTTVSLLYIGMALLSLVSLRIFRLARQEHDSAKVDSFASEVLSVAKIPACRHVMVYGLVEAVFMTVILQGAVYYLTLVDGLSGTRRSIFLAAAVVVVALALLIALPLWTQFFRVRRPNVNTNLVCGTACLLGVPLGPLSLLLGRALPPGCGFLLYVFVLQVAMVGQSFWKCLALGWVVDEDCHASHGRRREAVFVGVLSFVGAIGRAMAVGLVINGLGAVGLQFEFCDQVCDGLRVPCKELCERRNIEGQPEAVKVYIQVLYYGVMPVCQALVAILAIAFPIRGERLDAIYRNQAQIFKPTSLDLPKPANEQKGLNGVRDQTPPVAQQAPSERKSLP